MTAVRKPGRPALLAGLVLTLALAVAVGVLAGARLTSATEAPPAPDDRSVDAGFARDMRDHHAQAVEMSVLLREATDEPQIRGLALDILLTQQQQIGQMYGWLSSWGLSQASSEPALAWMGNNAGDTGGSSHGSMDMGGGNRMPGMASDEDLEELARARGQRAERLYLQLMIPHHRAGVQMAEHAARNASTSVVRDLAQRIVDSQKAEIDVLRAMLSARGGPVRLS